MTRLRVVLSRVLGLFGRRWRDEDLADDIEAHLDLLTAEYIKRGMSPADAGMTARREFGGVEQVKEAYRDRRGLLWFEQFWQDLRYAVRTFGRSPGFSVVAILILGLGIGANAALFDVTHAVLFRRLPVQQPQSLVELGCVNPRNPDDACRMSYPGFETLRKSSGRVLSGMFAFAPATDLIAEVGGRAEKVEGLLISGEAYSLLGISAHAGRLLTPADDKPDAPIVAVLSFQFWQRRFGGDPAVLGRTLHLDDRIVTIVGITPPFFRGLRVGFSPDVTISISNADIFRQPGSLESQTAWWVYAMGRLKPGITASEAQAVLAPAFRSTLQATIDALPAGAAAGIQDFVEHFRFRVTSAATGGISYFRQTLEGSLQLLWLIVALVLLTACINIGGLLLSRAVDRTQEFRVRLALGAGQARLARQVLTEALLLAVVGGALGVTIACWLAPLGLALGVGGMGLRAVDLGIDSVMLVFATLLSIVVAMAIGLGCVWSVTRGAAASHPTRVVTPRVPIVRALIVGQVALSMALLVIGILFARSLLNARAVDPGFDSAALITMEAAPGTASSDSAGAMAWMRRAVEAADQLPGVESATYYAFPLATGLVSQTAVRVPGLREAARVVTGENRVGPRFARTVGLKLIAGRDLLLIGDESTSPRAALVNERFVRRFYKNATDALGRQFDLGGRGYSIVGVVGDAHDRSVVRPPESWVYVSFTPDPSSRVLLIVRTAGAARPLITTVEKSVQAVDPAVPVYDAHAVSTDIKESLRRERFLAIAGISFAGLALVLTALGIFAIFKGMVGRRRHEIGIRAALGADPSSVRRMVVVDALRLTAAGLVVGVPMTLAAAISLRSLLFGVAPDDVPTIAGVCVVLAVTAWLAAYVPARKASRVDPVVTLRAE